MEFMPVSGSVTSTGGLPGDVDGNAQVNGIDRAYLARHLAKWDGYEQIQTANADVDASGSVTAIDRTVLARHLARWDGYETLPYNRQNDNSAALFSFDTGSIQVENGRTAAGDDVSVRIVMTNNPGIVSMSLQVHYDYDALTLISVEDGGIAGSTWSSPSLGKVPYTLSWGNDTLSYDLTETGVLATLTFHVSEDAAGGSYPIQLSYETDGGAIFNAAMQDVQFDLVQGQITVAAAPEEYTILFDANGGSGSMPEIRQEAGSYSLPSCGFGAPKDMLFDQWEINGELFDAGRLEDTVVIDNVRLKQWTDIQGLEGDKNSSYSLLLIDGGSAPVCIHWSK